jgi:hypothetical protein
MEPQMQRTAEKNSSGPSPAAIYSDIIDSDYNEALSHYQAIPELFDSTEASKSSTEESSASGYSDEASAYTETAGYIEESSESLEPVSAVPPSVEKSANEKSKPADSGYSEASYSEDVDSEYKISNDGYSTGGYSDYATKKDEDVEPLKPTGADYSTYSASGYTENTNSYGSASYQDDTSSVSGYSSAAYSEEDSGYKQSNYATSTSGYQDNYHSTQEEDAPASGYSTNYSEESATQPASDEKEKLVQEKEGASSTPKAHGGGAVVIPPGRNWNLEFQKLKSLPISTKEEILSKCRAYRDLAAEFRETAIRVGRIIIDEKWLPEDKKTVHSVAVGGIAGGEKFMSEGSNPKVPKFLPLLLTRSSRYIFQVCSR